MPTACTQEGGAGNCVTALALEGAKSSIAFASCGSGDATSLREWRARSVRVRGGPARPREQHQKAIYRR